ncbi:MAG TPA: trypsin-like peptidase domain-containing protein [Acidimicrobiales bacterium]|nr:trypsin-like peptidase domain-containing protein [Acidimicrobiales bacterium]
MSSTTPPTSTPPPSTSAPGASHHKIAWEKIGVFAIVALVGGLVGGFVGYYLHTTSGTASAATGSSSSCSIPKIADQVLPSVVTISARKGATGGTGSGSIIRSDGYILTNNHVVGLAANGGSVSVLFSNGKTLPATITGRDPLTDVAVIKVDASKLPAISEGSSTDLVVGQTVVALGAPLGLSSTVTSGIVSALDRTIAVPGEGVETALLIDAIQTDASINPGNSGGALVNCSGQLIGMPSAGASVPTSSGEATGGSVGLNFAIPIALASAEANEIIDTGHVTHAYFGLTAVPLSPDASLVHGVAEGLLVTAVDAGGPSAQAGLRVGDIITQLNGQSVVSTDELVSLTLTQKPGDKVKVTYVRDGKTSTTTVTLGAQPSAPPATPPTTS